MSSFCSFSDLVTDLLFGPWHYLHQYNHSAQSLYHTQTWFRLPAPGLIALFLSVFVSEILIFEINTEILMTEILMTEILMIMMDEIIRAHQLVSR
jgi:hypothetical protein